MPGWQGGFGAPGITSNQFTPQVNALHVWDPDGPGPLDELLVIGGAFISAGGTNSIEGHSVNHIILWDGQTFRGMPGLNGQVLCLEVDIANVIHAGGHFTSTPTGPANALPRIARFDANLSIWRDLAGNGFDAQVNAIHTEPSGDLMVGGLFANFTAGGEANRLVRWNGAAWSSVPWLFNSTVGAPAPVWCIFDLPDSQYRMHVGLDSPMGGSCVRAPSQPQSLPPISILPGPFGGRAHAGLQTPNGRRWAGGSFTGVIDNAGFVTPASRIAFSDSESDPWVQAGAGLDGTVHALAADGNTVYAGGRFFFSGSTPVNNVARWNGTSWQPMGGGFDADVFALAFYKGDLYAGGMFGYAEGNAVHGIARWDGDQWRALGHGSYPIQSNPAITAIAKFENLIVAAGRFTALGGLPVVRVGQFDGDQWNQLGQGFPEHPHGMMELDGDLYATGVFKNSAPANAQYELQRFSPAGSLWVQLSGFDQYFSEVIKWNNQIVVGGWFTVSGSTQLSRIAMRDANGIWQQMGAGFNAPVLALTILNGDLIAGGSFSMSGTTAVNRVARWDSASSTWQPMGPGVPGSSSSVVEVLHIHNGELYAGGTFDGYLRRWDGSSWVQVGDPAAFGGCFGGVAALASYRGDLIVGGGFSCGQNGILRWNGTSYGPMAPGAPSVPNVSHLVAIDGDMWVSGVFNSAGGLPAGGLTRWRDDATWVVIAPENVTADPGDDVVFTARSSHPGNYFWFHDGDPVSGGSVFDPQLVVPDVGSSDAGAYQCRLQTLCAGQPVLTDSNVATLVVGGAILGDMNCDNVVDLLDVAPFALALVDESAYIVQYACDPNQGDINNDGAVDGRDVSPMAQLLIP